REIVAKPENVFRFKRLLFAVLLIAGGLWFGYDGFIGYPKTNAELDRLIREDKVAEKEHNETKRQELAIKLKSYTFHNSTAIIVQKVLLFTLTPGGLIFAFVILRGSRGELRYADHTLHVPGHEPIALDKIISIDDARWEKKGISFVTYKKSDG